MQKVSQTGVCLSTAQAAALRAVHRALARATEVALFDELAAHYHPDILNRFCDAVTEVARETDTDTDLSYWTVLYGPVGLHFTCLAEDIHHAIEQCENAHPGVAIATAFEGKNESQVDVVNWISRRYGEEGTGNDSDDAFTLGVWDRRGTGGKLEVTMAPAEGDTDDLLYAMFEVNRLPGSKDDTQCLHIHFDSENLAMSVFKQGNKFILRPENRVTVLNTTLPNGEKALIVQ